MSTKELKRFKKAGIDIVIVKGDITTEKVDAIVNAANSHLQHGGGVAGAIVRAGGESIQRESDEYVKENGPVPTGGVAVTGAGNLKAKYVIHAVGPVWKGGKADEEKKLSEAVYNSLKKAHELGLCSISMPAISSGIFGFPKERCAEIFFETIARFLKEHKETSLKEIRLCNIDSETCEIFLEKSEILQKEEV
ncbi:MAG: putative ATPase [Thermotogota bacterium]|nr:putative ATPase [Thermotogota bacterium]MDK2865048.1 putative ATPase [Thermotogota bacterium]HCZ06008.1 Appr-1-p processing protein [Thermotogota bacterium]